MIYIDKSAFPRPEKLDGKTTNKRRNEIIEAKEFLKGDIYNSRYKTNDIKKTLDDLYNGKCAFCETNIERWDVEHFRPKDLYPWLAYSWDNLLLACPTCNGYKNNHFETINNRVEYNDEDLEQIHNLGTKYDEIENNKFINPEREKDIEEKIKFDENGKIFSDDKKMKYTIKTCKLDREKLNIERKKQVLNQYEVELKIKFDRLEKSKNEQRFNEDIEDLRKAFKIQTENKKNNFIAFRRYALKKIIL